MALVTVVTTFCPAFDDSFSVFIGIISMPLSLFLVYLISIFFPIFSLAFVYTIAISLNPCSIYVFTSHEKATTRNTFTYYLLSSEPPTARNN